MVLRPFRNLRAFSIAQNVFYRRKKQFTRGMPKRNNAVDPKKTIQNPSFFFICSCPSLSKSAFLIKGSCKFAFDSI